MLKSNLEFLPMKLGIWVSRIIEEFESVPKTPGQVYFNNNGIALTDNLAQFDRIKHIEVDMHFKKKKIDADVICISYLPTKKQTTGMLTKDLSKGQFDKLLNKLAMEVLYRPTWRGMLDFLCIFVILDVY